MEFITEGLRRASLRRRFVALFGGRSVSKRCGKIGRVRTRFGYCGWGVL
jgi:hypothetical protein